MLKIQQRGWKQTWRCVIQMVMGKIRERIKIQSPLRNWSAANMTRVFVFPWQFALLSFPTCSPFYITDYHHKPHNYLSFHLCFSSKCLNMPTKTCEKIDLLSILVWQVLTNQQQRWCKSLKTWLVSVICCTFTEFYFIFLELNNESLIGWSSV